MNDEQQSLILKSAANYPPPQGVKLSYGTAGFRADATLLKSTVYRVGILAALRSLKTSEVIGLMITASHNKVSDNGVKIADPSGGMLTQDWEPFADQLANASDENELLKLINEFVKQESIPVDGVCPAKILLGRDTRPSGESLLEAAKEVLPVLVDIEVVVMTKKTMGITAIVGAVAIDMGIVTTPQLHWMVRATKTGMKATEIDYFEQLSSSFRCLVEMIPNDNEEKKVDDILAVDGANGVGGEKLEVLRSMLTNLVVEVRNSGKGGGVLNEGVGADYVQKERVAPSGFGPGDVGIRCASLDGDADRLVYFTVPSNESHSIDLLDGDKILSLFAIFMREQLCILNEGQEKINSNSQARLGVVQTAYANGASTDYLKQLGLEVVFTPTGVKYLHEKAAQYDVGIYFEANGHGTILFSESFLRWLEARHTELSSAATEQLKAASRLLAVSRLINQAVGDALSGLLLVEAILQHMGWSIKQWNDLYHDLPSRQLKVKVADRSAVVTANAETVVVSPPGIQDAINAEIAKYSRGRSFVRPSGTEDVVRVFAEASTQEAADNLASSVARLIDQFLGSGSS